MPLDCVTVASQSCQTDAPGTRRTGWEAVSVSNIHGQLACLDSTDSRRLPQHHRLAIVVPLFGGAAKGLPRLCHRLGNHLDHMGMRFDIFAVNQVDDLPFNRGALLNIGVQYALSSDRRRAYDYLALQDVDRFPANTNRELFKGHLNAFHAFPDERPRALNPDALAGGVLVVATKAFRAVNGLSNSYWGYGSEDNDLFLRLRWCGWPPIHGARSSRAWSTQLWCMHEQ